MKWRRVGGGGDVIDTRGASRGAGLPGGRVALPGGLGLVGVLVYLAIQVLGGGGGSGGAFDVPGAFDTGTRAPTAAPIPASQDPERDLKDFSVYVFTDVQNMWERTFQRDGHAYEHAKLVLYRAGVSTGGCGSASSAVGPFYCPGDQRVYLDLSFEREMTDRLGAPGDFAWAYVIAHEMGHHVQQQLGTSDSVRREQQADPSKGNELSVRLELQADCYSGVWAHGAFAAGQLEEGDIKEALDAAQAVGDDRLQRQARGSVDPDSFTHGTSAQRMTWFRKGYDGGDPGACDTFGPAQV
jgi:predicted metalloprotease